MAQPNTPVRPPTSLDEIEMEMKRLQLEVLRKQNQELDEKIATKESEAELKKRFRETVGAESRRYREAEAYKQATCSHRLSNGRPAIVGQRDMHGKTIYLCQICQQIKQGNDEFMSDPKWAGLAHGVSMEAIGGPQIGA